MGRNLVVQMPANYFLKTNSLTRLKSAFVPKEIVPLLRPSFHVYRAGYQVSFAIMLDAYVPTIRGMPIVRLPLDLRAVTGERSAFLNFAAPLGFSLR